MLSYPFTSRVTYDDQGLPLYDRAVDSSFLRQVFSKYFSDGVHYNPANALQVIADTDMNVKVYPGTVHIQGALGIEPVERILAVQASETLDRIDTVVARLDLSSEIRSVDLYIVQGVAAETPARPELTRNNTIWELGLADLFIAKNTSVVSQDRITDTRLDTERCGLMGPNITTLDTTPYYEQIIALGKLMEEEIANIKAGTDSMLRSVYDKDNDNIVDNAKQLDGHEASYFATSEAVTNAQNTADTAKTTANNHVANTSNPHSVTKSQVGLGNVDNAKQMPIAGGTFTGDAVAYSTNRSTSSLRNIEIRTTSATGTLQSTNKIIMVRK